MGQAEAMFISLLGLGKRAMLEVLGSDQLEYSCGIVTDSNTKTAFQGNLVTTKMFTYYTSALWLPVPPACIMKPCMESLLWAFTLQLA